MSKPTSYQLLKDIHEATSNLEKKLDKRITLVEEKQDTIETRIDTMAGKATVGMIILSTVIGTGISLIVDWFKNFGAK